MTRRTLLLAVLALFILGVMAPAAVATSDGGLLFATAEMEDDGADVSDEPTSDVTPAVEAVDPAEEEDDQPWTSRVLVPAVLAIGALGVVAATGYYIVRVRGKYRVV